MPSLKRQRCRHCLKSNLNLKFRNIRKSYNDELDKFLKNLNQKYDNLKNTEAEVIGGEEIKQNIVSSKVTIDLIYLLDSNTEFSKINL